MRAVVALITCASVAAGIAWAQELAQPLDTSQLEWDQRPNEFARRYPRAAQARNLPGAAVVCCAINERRRLDCETAFEWPQGYGFGDATVAVQGEYRLSQASYDQLMASPDRDRPIRRTMRWSLPDFMTPETEAAFDRISAAAETMCVTPSP